MNRPFRIATWNLEKPGITGNRADAIHQQISIINADVWVLTETKLCFSPGDEYQLAAVSEKDSKLPDKDRWVAIWVHKQYSCCFEETQDNERTACTLIHNPEGRKLYVYGTVLPWLTDNRFSNVRGSARFIKALEEQEKDWCEIRNKYPEAILCVAGDFNQDLLPTGHFYGSKAGREALLSALKRSELKCLTGGTEDPVARLYPGKASIDHICLAGQIHGGSKPEIWPKPDESGARVSDHFGAVADFEFI